MRSILNLYLERLHSVKARSLHDSGGLLRCLLFRLFGLFEILLSFLVHAEVFQVVRYPYRIDHLLFKKLVDAPFSVL